MSHFKRLKTRFGFVQAHLFHLVRKTLEGNLPMPSLEVVQAIIEPSTEEDLPKLQAKLAVEAIATFEENIAQQITPILPFDVPLDTCLAYLTNVTKVVHTLRRARPRLDVLQTRTFASQRPRT